MNLFITFMERFAGNYNMSGDRKSNIFQTYCANILNTIAANLPVNVVLDDISIVLSKLVLLKIDNFSYR